MRRLVAILLVAGFLFQLAGSKATADDIMFTQAEAAIGFVPSYTSYDNTVQGAQSASVQNAASLTYPGQNTVSSATSFAQTNPFSYDWMRLNAATVYTEALVAVSGVSAASSSASWRDVISYDGSSGPQFLQVQVQIEGVLGATATPGSGSFSEIWVSGYNRFELHTGDNLFWYGGGPGSPAGFTSAILLNYPVSNTYYFNTYGQWQSFTTDGNAFKGVYTFDATYDPAAGGYTWGIEVVASSSSSGYQDTSTSGSADLLDTVQLTSVNLPDGTPISPSELQFASGLSPPSPNPRLLWQPSSPYRCAWATGGFGVGLRSLPEQ